MILGPALRSRAHSLSGAALMSDLVVNAVGVGAGLCSMASFVPQLVKISRAKDASGVSLRMFAITIVGFALWTTYGVLQNSWPIIGTNAVCFVLASSIFALRLRYGGEARAGTAA
jgi:MtN3 and saliva related transmembrane protein